MSMPGFALQFRWTLAAVIVGALAVVLVAVYRPRSNVAAPGSEHQNQPLAAVAGQPWFVDVTAGSGIDFRHFDPATPTHYIQETLGSGLAWIDYNNDGWPDLFVVQDCPIQPGAAPIPSLTNKLYRNNGDGTFTDVTAETGLAHGGFGFGCSVGDFDNDGWDDLVVTYQGGIVLYHNEPDGKGGRRFVDVTKKARLDNNPHMATSCAWGDIDGDGFLDLYVCNSSEVDFKNYPDCGKTSSGLYKVCSPLYFPCTSHKLYRNNGDGTFTDISLESGIGKVMPAPGLAVLMADLDGDGKIDIYVANDMKPAYLFHNQGGGKFVEKAVLSGCGLDMSGTEVAGMGIDAGDLDGSGRPSLFVTNYQARPNMLYLNRGGMRFQESSFASGLGTPSLPRLKFGTVFFDADLDGYLDIAVANGHVQRYGEQVNGIPTAQEAQLFLGDGRGHFRDVSAQSGRYFNERFIGRGLAYADYDNDGRPDLAFSHVGERIALLHNETETANNWLTLELRGDGRRSNRNAIGAKVEIEYGGQRQVRFINGGGSYLSANERRVLAGLGPARLAEVVRVTWPSGRRQEFRDLEARKWYRLDEGSDQAVVVVPGKVAR
jgi:enediyne biosynthesis protein E4